ncbi:hypothetical protein [Desulfosporosinus sp. BG]|uniref:hypothetical protein n=1 Tax=Desulfosporosinus sp. BG TaxID=1633135 RepID=UPI00083A87DD|nr:hypothetical protein [Desulfosporosinus sp. BG]ODA40912.1 hypothetical protein DSBG_2353 [Desulfosporosinus sp. BG]
MIIMPMKYLGARPKYLEGTITILFHLTRTKHIMDCLLIKEEKSMAFGGAGVDGACTPNFLPGI